MANGHVEIHDAPSGPAGAPPPGSPDSMDGSVELRLLMAYATRRRPATRPESPVENGGDTTENGDANGSTRTEEKKTSTKKRKKKGWNRLSSIFKCVRPQTEDAGESLPRGRFSQSPPAANQDDVQDRRLKPDRQLPRRRRDQEEDEEDEDVDPLVAVASRLTALADEIPFVPPDIESDAPEGSGSQEVEVLIGLLLRESGDRYQQELRDANVAAELFWNYGFFRALMNGVLTRMGLRSADPDAPGPQASPKTQIAVTCEITSRLSAVDTLPMSRLLHHGARYLQDCYSPWAQQQGGYEEAFREDEEEEDEEEEVH